MEGFLFVLSVLGVLALRLYAERAAEKISAAANEYVEAVKAHAEQQRQGVTVLGTPPVDDRQVLESVHDTDCIAPDDAFLSSDQARTLIAMQLMQSGMDPSKEASWHAAAEDVIDIEMGDLESHLERQSEAIRMEDDEAEYQASLEAEAAEAAEAERYELERRDETIRMDDD